MDQTQSLLNSLFDFSFSEFITTRIIKILYGIGIFFSAIGALMLIINGFTRSFGTGILILIISPIIFLIYVIIVRVTLELIIVLFRIADHVSIIAKAKQE